MTEELNIVNLFCGMGGDELGIRDAVYKDLKMTYRGLSINHWDVAVATMRANFGNVKTLNCKIEEAVPGDLVPWGTVVHLLWASPSCTHHSRAKGGMPRCNQLRSQPEYVMTWIAQTRIKACDIPADLLTLILENCPLRRKGACMKGDAEPVDGQ